MSRGRSNLLVSPLVRFLIVVFVSTGYPVLGTIPVANAAGSGTIALQVTANYQDFPCWGCTGGSLQGIASGALAGSTAGVPWEVAFTSVPVSGSFNYLEPDTACPWVGFGDGSGIIQGSASGRYGAQTVSGVRVNFTYRWTRHGANGSPVSAAVPGEVLVASTVTLLPQNVVVATSDWGENATAIAFVTDHPPLHLCGEGEADPHPMSFTLVGWNIFLDDESIEPPDLNDPLGNGEYPSVECTTPGATNVINGYLGNTYLTLRADQPDTQTMRVCVTVDDGSVHQGGRVDISASAPGTPTPYPGLANQCVLEPENIRLRSGTYAGGNNYWLDVTPKPNEVWVCAKVEPHLDYKLVVPTGGGGVPVFLPDLALPYPGYTSPISPGPASDDCQTGVGGTKTRMINAQVGTGRVWLYTWQESSTRAHLCFRSEIASQGRRITLDTNGGQSVITPVTSNLPACTWDVIDDEGPPPFSIYLDEAPPGSPPVSACVKVNTSYLSVTLNPSGGQGVMTVTSD